MSSLSLTFHQHQVFLLSLLKHSFSSQFLSSLSPARSHISLSPLKSLFLLLDLYYLNSLSLLISLYLLLSGLSFSSSFPSQIFLSPLDLGLILILGSGYGFSINGLIFHQFWVEFPLFVTGFNGSGGCGWVVVGGWDLSLDIGGVELQRICGKEEEGERGWWEHKRDRGSDELCTGERENIKILEYKTIVKPCKSTVTIV